MRCLWQGCRPELDLVHGLWFLVPKTDALLCATQTRLHICNLGIETRWRNLVTISSVEEAKQCCYLGELLNSEGGVERTVRNRVSAA